MIYSNYKYFNFKSALPENDDVKDTERGMESCTFGANGSEDS